MAARNNLRVLIVDDDDADVYALRRHLERVEGATFDIQVERTDQQAVRAIETQEFDIYFIDFWLGSGTSIKFILDLLNRMPSKVVMVTGMGCDSVKELGFSAGASAYLDKSDISRDSVQDVVRRLCA